MLNQSLRADPPSIAGFSQRTPILARSTDPLDRPSSLRIAVVDHDTSWRERFLRLLASRHDVEIVGAGRSGEDAAALAASRAPDVLLLAIRPPYLNGIAAFNAIPRDRRPGVIFVADRDAYAGQAYEMQAVDYLLTPVTPERFDQALTRARRLVGAVEPPAPVLQPGAERAVPSRLLVKGPGSLTFVVLDEIDWIQSAGNYVQVHAGAEVHLMRGTVKNLEVRLGPRFLRIHRSCIVNIDRIKRITTDEAGHASVVLRDGMRIAAGRYIEGRLREWMTSGF